MGWSLDAFRSLNEKRFSEAKMQVEDKPEMEEFSLTILITSSSIS
jgi:hypothetical protein